jgi:hypothetical protein
MPGEHCAHYVYDEYGDYYYCDIDLDEDEMIRFMEGNTADCPYYDSDDEYEIVRHQV